MIRAIADFETVNDPKDCRVWGFSLYVPETKFFTWGKTIEDFFDVFFTFKTSTIFYFHNLKFDGDFILYYLFENGFEWCDKRKLGHKEFSTLIDYMGNFYSITINYDGRHYVIYDSLKIIPMPVKKMSKAFGLKSKKGDIDYNKPRPKGYDPTPEEVDYMKNDVVIVGEALQYFFDQGLKKMTQASNAMGDYQSIIDKKNFRYWFPILKCDKEIRPSYKGGFTYANPKFQGQEVEGGIVLDVNSLYPYVMYHYPIPYGEPKRYWGEPETDVLYNLFIHTFKCSFEIKTDMIPSIQIKGDSRFNPRKYLTSSNGIEVTLCLTSVDYEMFKERYKVFNIQHLQGFKFMSSTNLFTEYIEKWTQVKADATNSGNEGLRTIAKLMQNALYGKLALNPDSQSKIPYYDDETKLVKFRFSSKEERDPVYLPAGTFITAYARRETLTVAQDNLERFYYSDTDSVHLKGFDIPKGIRVHKSDLGAWDFEAKFLKARFLRAKSYIEELFITIKEYDKLKPEKQKPWKFNGEVYTLIKVTCAGMPSGCHQYVTFENFVNGVEYKGKLQSNRVHGGRVLLETTFTLNLTNKSLTKDKKGGNILGKGTLD